jgi:hypothetical protein
MELDLVLRENLFLEIWHSFATPAKLFKSIWVIVRVFSLPKDEAAMVQELENLSRIDCRDPWKSTSFDVKKQNPARVRRRGKD